MNKKDKRAMFLTIKDDLDRLQINDIDKQHIFCFGYNEMRKTNKLNKTE